MIHDFSVFPVKIASTFPYKSNLSCNPRKLSKGSEFSYKRLRRSQESPILPHAPASYKFTYSLEYSQIIISMLGLSALTSNFLQGIMQSLKHCAVLISVCAVQ